MGRAFPQRVCDRRSGIYGLLARVYLGEPDAELLREVYRPSFQSLMEELRVDLGRDLCGAPLAQLEEDLAVEYARLFIGPGPHLSPHESVYVGEFSEGSGLQGLLWGETTVRLAGAIEEAGLVLDPSAGVIPDHIGVELDLMRILIEREKAAWAGGEVAAARGLLETQGRFMEEHLARWVPGFCEGVVAHARLPFYRGMGELTRAYVLFDREELRQRVQREGEKP